MFVKRLISSIVLLAVIITTVVLGGEALFLLTAIVSLIGLMEIYRLSKLHKTLPGIVGYLSCAVYYALLYFNRQEYLFELLVVLLLVLMIVFVLRYPVYHSSQIAMTFFGFFYVAVMLSYLYQVRMLENGVYMIWLVFIGAWGSDTCAYCVGMLFGKHKLPNELSPKKSIEGCIGGVVGAAFLGFAYATVFREQITAISNPTLWFAVIGGVSSILSQIGDLAASGIKRNHNIKDYGNLIPGHGGIMDRFDSIIFTAPICFVLLKFIL